MAKSLQQQLLEAGAIKKDRATQIKKATHKKNKQKQRGSNDADEVKAAALKAQAEKTERDRKINRQREAEIADKAIAAQIRQLIETNAIDNQHGEIPYRFTDDKIVKTINVDEQQRQALVKGKLCIARAARETNASPYALIPLPVAQKIIERDATMILVMNEGDDPGSKVDDAYAEYEIPDDLTW